MISIYKSLVETPSVLKKNKEGQVLGWETFGGNVENLTVSKSLGLAFTSPLLYLKEGVRIITIKLSFETTINQELFNRAKYYLSTKTEWLELEMKGGTESVGSGNNLCEVMSVGDNTQEIILKITLNSTEKSIENFAKNPDGINVSWPMFKMMFNQFETLSAPPTLSNIDIRVDVTGVQTFTLNSDYGVLNTKKPFQLFGPTPELNNSFIIGSEEIFSKPLSFLNIKIDWDALPTNFQDYYQAYNNNLDLGPVIDNSGFFKKVSGKAKTDKPVVETGPFNNTCFINNFNVLQDQQWNTLTSIKQNSCSFNEGEGTFVCDNYTIITPAPTPENSNEPKAPPVSNVNVNELLFSTSDKNILVPNSIFSFQIDPTILKPDYALQLSPLTFTDKSANGFIKMNLIGPEMGFGSSDYPKVVSNIALKNAKELMDKKSSSHVAANLPFVPKVKLLSANYSAAQAIQLDFTQTDVPFQCFAYTPNSTYQVYDSCLDIDFNANINQTTLDGIQTKKNGLALFPSVESKGLLYLSLENVVTPCELNLYVELARKVGSIPSEGEINYRYLTASGWKDMRVLADETKNFTCSGIIKVSIPDDICRNHESMPNDKYWLSIGVPNNSNSYADTIYLQTNGFEVERTGTSFLSDLNTPKLKAGSIIKTVDLIPEISKVVQQFPSFSGLGAEDALMMNKRVSTRLRTKGRVINSVDYYNLIQQEFPEIFYSKSVYNKANRTTQIYLVKKFEEVNNANAFMPLVSVCEEEVICEFLTKRAPAFANIEVLNFVPEYVSISADISVDKKYGLGEMEKEINAKLNLFLSPWIESDAIQLEIDQGLTASQLLNLIKNIEGVINVSSIEINKKSDVSTKNEALSGGKPSERLLVTSQKHTLTCNHLL